MCTVLVTYAPDNKIAQGLMDVLAMTTGVEIDGDAMQRKKRIPVSKVYWKKGDYKELVEDPFNLK